MRVLVFGASITQGFWDTHGGWVQRLRSYYDEFEVQYSSNEQPTIFNLGVSGDKAADVINRFEAETKARWSKLDRIAFIFSIGTNNAAVDVGGREWSSPDEYYRQLIDLVEKARRYSNKIMFVGLAPCEEHKTVPVAWADIEYTNARLKLFEDVMRQFCKQQGIPHIPLFETMVERNKPGRELFADGLHPNNDGHQMIYELVRPELDKLLDT